VFEPCARQSREQTLQAHFMLAVANAGAMPLRTSRHCGEALSCVTRLVLWVALVSCRGHVMCRSLGVAPADNSAAAEVQHSSATRVTTHQVDGALVAPISLFQARFARQHLVCRNAHSAQELTVQDAPRAPPLPSARDGALDAQSLGP